jgi:hypothetical protein
MVLVTYMSPLVHIEESSWFITPLSGLQPRKGCLGALSISSRIEQEEATQHLF